MTVPMVPMHCYACGDVAEPVGSARSPQEVIEQHEASTAHRVAVDLLEIEREAFTESPWSGPVGDGPDDAVLP